MSAPATLAIAHVETSSPPAFILTRLSDGKSAAPVTISSPYQFPVESQPNSNLMDQLRWYLETSSPPAFILTRLSDGKSAAPVTISSPYQFPVKSQPNSNLMDQLRWYLEHFLDYPFDPEIGHAERVLDALQAWGTQAFNALFDRRDAGD